MSAVAETMYTEVAGCIVYIGGRLGETKSFRHSSGRTVGAFVQLANPEAETWAGDMLYVELSAVPVGDRGTHREILNHRTISRDEFDVLTGLAQARRDMGWTA